MKKIIEFTKKLEARSYKLNKGMTYVELIVVLSIFAVMSAIAMYNYGEFQAKVDIKNLASDIALKIVEAQNSALSGKLSTQSFLPKPSYGVYFNTANPGGDNKSFFYFADFDNGNDYDGGAEKLDTISIKKGNYIDKIEIFGTNCPNNPIPALTIVFRRPDSKAIISPECTSIFYVEIKIKSPKKATSIIRIYPSGRVQVN